MNDTLSNMPPPVQAALVEQCVALLRQLQLDGDQFVARLGHQHGLHRTDLKALAHAVGGKRGAIAEPAVAERSTGYVVGGISPLGQRTRLPTVVDETAELWDTVVVSAGRRGLSVELAPDDLVRLTGAVVADVSR